MLGSQTARLQGIPRVVGVGGSALRANLVEQARRAIERGGLRFDDARDMGYLHQRFAIANPFAARATSLLYVAAEPTTSIEFSLLGGIPEMAAFGCTIADLTYQLAASRTDHRADLRWALVTYLVASAIFDYACDEDTRILVALSRELSEGRMRDMLDAGLFTSEFPIDAPTLGRYCWSMTTEFFRVALRVSTEQSREVISLNRARNQLKAILIESYRAELASVSTSRRSGQRGSVVWSSPLLVAYYLLQICNDAAATIDATLESSATTVGHLLSLIDDVADIEEDLASASENSLIAFVQARIGEDSSKATRSALASDDICRPYMDAISTRIQSCLDMPWAHELGAWLFYWLR